MSELRLRVAAKAVIVNQQKQVLLVREAPTDADNTQVGKWGICGGRLKPGEAFVDGLKREAKEEVGLEVEPIKPLYVGEWRPTIHSIKHQIIAIFMLCQAKSSTVVLSPEHDSFVWIKPKEYRNYPMMPPDDLVIEALISDFKNGVRLKV